MKKEKNKFFTNLHINNFTDNKKFWKTVKPLFTNCDGGSQKITLLKNDKIISNDKEVAETFNEFFENSVKSLNIPENSFLKIYVTQLKKQLQHLKIIQV